MFSGQFHTCIGFLPHGPLSRRQQGEITWSRKGTGSDHKVHCRLTVSPRQVRGSASLCSWRLESGTCFVCIMALEQEDEFPMVGRKEEVRLLVLVLSLSLRNSLLLWTVFRDRKVLGLCDPQEPTFFYLIPLSFSHLLSQAISFFLKIIIIIITHCYYLKQGLTLWPRLAFMDQPLGDDLSYVPPRPVSALLYVVVWCSCVCIFWHRCFSGCVVWSQKSALFLRQWLTLPTLPRTYWLGRGCWQPVSGSQLSLLPCTGAVSVPLHATTSASFSLGSGDGTHFLLLGRCALYRRRHRLSSSDGVGTGR